MVPVQEIIGKIKNIFPEASVVVMRDSHQIPIAVSIHTMKMFLNAIDLAALMRIDIDPYNFSAACSKITIDAFIGKSYLG